MQRCLLEGHKPVKRAGAGAYGGQSFLVCSECGLMLGGSHPHPLPFGMTRWAYGRGPAMNSLPEQRAENERKRRELSTPGTMSWPPLPPREDR